MKNVTIPSHLRFFPAIFAVKNVYQIFIATSEETVAAIRIGDRTYYDESNGILRSLCYAHKIEVPMDELDAAGEYTVITRKVIDRSQAHAPCTEPLPDATFAFRSTAGKHKLNIYHIADVHNNDDIAISAGKYFGDSLDLLILNGDIPNHCSRVQKFDTVYHVISELTHGELPCVFARGNHDTRGAAAETFGQYTPTYDSRTYYTFQIGSLWGMVLDCGEDKNDDHKEYAGTVCFHSFRERETDFIKNVIKNAKSEYLADGVKYRLVISHIPFTHIYSAPFDIEQDTYSEWARLLREDIKPDLMLHGHLHVPDIWEKGCKKDDLGQPCTSIIGAGLKRFRDGDRVWARFTGCALTLDLNTKSTHVVFNNDEGEILLDKDI